MIAPTNAKNHIHKWLRIKGHFEVPWEVQFKQLPGFFSPKGPVEQRRELAQLRADCFHILLAQLTVERRVRFP